MSDLKLLPAGDSGLAVEFGTAIDPAVNDQVHALAKRLKNQKVPGIREMIPSFRSLLILYDPVILTFQELKELVLRLAPGPGAQDAQTRRVRMIPCCYGSCFAPDLADLERHTGLTRDEIISIHSSVDYKIYMLGFLPGFVYLGGLDRRIEMPRLPVPRVRIPRGAVGIGGSQTGVYPLDSPGGWRLIGNTPLDFYDPEREEPVLCKAGEYIRFQPISSCDYYDIRQMILRGTYRPEIRTETA